MATAYAAAGITTSMATTAALRHHLSKTTPFSGNWSPLPHLRPRLASSINLSNDSKRLRLSCVKIRASSSEDTSGSLEVGEVVSDLKEKWDAVEDKTSVLQYGGGAIVAVWLSVFVVGAVDSVPLLPTILELVGLGYTGWFVYRYLLSKATREELVTEIETLKNKITGTK